jgi:hypothetical protein
MSVNLGPLGPVKKTYHREEAVITKVVVENFREGPDAEPNTVNVWLEFGGGGASMFGGLALDRDGINVFISMLMATLGVSKQEDLVGQKCIALRSFGGFQEAIEGLESRTAGRRFTIRSFRKAMNFPAPSNLEQRTQRLKDDIARAERQIKEDKLRLKQVADNYVEFN